MVYPHKCVLLVGATSGIGLAMAEKFISVGSKVVVVGRRKERLNSFVEKHGSDKSGAVPFDVTNTAGLPQFVEAVTSKYPEIDCVFLNPGVARMYHLSKPSEVNLQEYHSDFNINYTSFVNFTHAILPFLMAKQTSTCLTYTGSNISIVPAATLSSYCAAKSALNVFVMCLREELAHVKSSVKIVEIFPPPVQTELHDVAMGTDKGRSFGMPVDVFVQQTYSKLAEGQEQVNIGSIGDEKVFMDVVNNRMKLFEGLSQIIWSQ